MLKIYGRKSSFNVQKVMWLVGELGVDHEHTELGGSFGGLAEPAFRAMNPHGRVPVIDDGGVIVWESHAIMRYLAARYGAGAFWMTEQCATSSCACMTVTSARSQAAARCRGPARGSRCCTSWRTRG